MNNFDYKGLDAALLSTVIAIYEENSVSAAANRLNVSQSTLSHRLEKLRHIFNDRLFVRNGRGIEPTLVLRDKIDDIIAVTQGLRHLLETPQIQPADIRGEFSIATTDYERHLFLFDTCRTIKAAAPNLTMNFVWQIHDSTQILRNNVVDLGIAPYLGQRTREEIKSTPIFEDYPVCYYDKTVAGPVTSMDDYLSRPHASVMFSEKDHSIIDGALSRRGLRRNVVLRFPSIFEAAQAVAGTDYILSMPSMTCLRDDPRFGTCPLPFNFSPLKYAMFWHVKNDNSPKHRWIREQIIAHAEPLTQPASHSE